MKSASISTLTNLGQEPDFWGHGLFGSAGSLNEAPPMSLVLFGAQIKLDILSVAESDIDLPMTGHRKIADCRISTRSV